MRDDHQHRLLLVDDDDDCRSATAELLRLEGHEVIEAAGGLEALETLRAGAAPCLVLLDLEMPEFSGRQFRMAQLHDPSLRGVPVVAVSGHGGIAQQATAMGMADYVAKPVDLDKLLGVIRRACRVAA